VKERAIKIEVLKKKERYLANLWKVVIVSNVDMGSLLKQKVLCPLSYIYDTRVFFMAKFHHLATQNKGRGVT